MVQVGDVYENLQKDTEPKVNLVVKCYDKIIELLNEAAQDIRMHNYQKKSESLSRAIEIITELVAPLDFARGKQIASGLNNIYMYSINRILQADREDDVSILKEIASLFNNLNEAWREVAKKELHRCTVNQGHDFIEIHAR